MHGDVERLRLEGHKMICQSNNKKMENDNDILLNKMDLKENPKSKGRVNINFIKKNSPESLIMLNLYYVTTIRLLSKRLG